MSPPKGSTSMPSWASVSLASRAAAASAGGSVHGLGHEQPLRFQLAGEDLLAELLVQNPLVQGVLVDDDHALVVLGDQVAVVNLKAEVRSAT